MKIYIGLIDGDRVQKTLYRLKVLFTANKNPYGYAITLHNVDHNALAEIKREFAKQRIRYKLEEHSMKLKDLIK